MIKEIRATVKTSYPQQIGSGTVYYTYEYGETREKDFQSKEDYEAEKALLWRQCENEVNKRIQATRDLYKKG